MSHSQEALLEEMQRASGIAAQIQGALRQGPATSNKGYGGSSDLGGTPAGGPIPPGKTGTPVLDELVEVSLLTRVPNGETRTEGVHFVKVPRWALHTAARQDRIRQGVEPSW